MRNYNLYIESGNQAYVLRLVKNGEDVSLLKLLCKNTMNADTLMSILAESCLSTYDGTMYDKNVTLTEVNVGEEGYDLVLTLRDCNNNKVWKGERRQGGLNVDMVTNPVNNLKSFVVRNTCGDDAQNNTYIIKIQYIENNDNRGNGQQEECYSGELEIHCLPSDSLFNVVLDCGSEASQMIVCREGPRDNPSMLLKGVVNHFYKDDESIANCVEGGEIAKRTLDQQEESDPRLFRSIFFEEKGAEFENEYERNQFIQSAPSCKDKHLQFVTKRTTTGSNNTKYQRLPNVKVSYLSPQVAGDYQKVYTIHKGIVARFMRESLLEVSEKLGGDAPAPVGVWFTLLVPNVMRQEYVADLIKCLEDTANNALFLRECHLNEESLVKIRSCSESDASLLYWLNKRENVHAAAQGRKFLVIDVGRGTSDFSVVNALDRNTVVSTFRSGCIGAGNVLSYAIFENYMYWLYYDKKDEAIKDFMFKAEPADLYRMEECIERKKREGLGDKYNEGRPAQPLNHFLSPDDLISRIDNAEPLSDAYHLISASMERLRAALLVSIPFGIEYDMVVLTGRAFYFKPWLDCMKEGLKEFLREYSPGVEPVFDPDSAKEGCLLGPLSPIKVNMYTNMVGIPNVEDSAAKPQIFDADTIKKTSQRNSSRCKFFCGLFNNKKERKEADDKGRWERAFRTVAESLLGSAIETMVTSGQYAQNFHSKARVLTPGKTVEEIIKMMNGGYKMEENYGSNTFFNISGNYYDVQDNVTEEDYNGYRLYFDGERFYLRGRRSSYLLENRTINADRQDLLFESLFPYSMKGFTHLSPPINKPHRTL